MRFGAEGTDPFGAPILSIDQSTSDEPVPSGVAPYSIRASVAALTTGEGASQSLSWTVTSADGAKLALFNPLNRVHARVADRRIARVTAAGDGGTVTGRRAGTTTLTLTYQRERASGRYRDVRNVEGARRELVRLTVPIRVTAAGAGR
jgi:hypothetical protein